MPIGRQDITYDARKLLIIYTDHMARGWESKSVEAQQAEASSQNRVSRPRLAPEQIQQKRKLEGLNLSRRRVEQQLAASREPRHQQMLRQALADLDAQIRELTRSV